MTSSLPHTPSGMATRGMATNILSCCVPCFYNNRCVVYQSRSCAQQSGARLQHTTYLISTIISTWTLGRTTNGENAFYYCKRGGRAPARRSLLQTTFSHIFPTLPSPFRNVCAFRCVPCCKQWRDSMNRRAWMDGWDICFRRFYNLSLLPVLRVQAGHGAHSARHYSVRWWAAFDVLPSGEKGRFRATFLAHATTLTILLSARAHALAFFLSISPPACCWRIMNMRCVCARSSLSP